jgi:hypothetical protein
VIQHAHRARWGWVYALAIVVTLLYLWAGYGAGWAWTGLSRRVTLWDWLEGLALPVTVGLVPLLLRHRDRLGRPHQLTGAALLTALTALVLAGYLVPWGWTGFTGNTLWDWLSLALLPVAIATSTLWSRPPHWTTRHTAWVTIAVAVALALVLAGYLVPWDWTGFTGNTAWDWIKLLLLPLLLPTVVLPRMHDVTEEWIAPRSQAPGREGARRQEADSSQTA